MTEETKLSAILDDPTRQNIDHHVWNVLFGENIINRIRKTIADYNPEQNIRNTLNDSPQQDDAYAILREYLRIAGGTIDEHNNPPAREFIGVIVALRDALPVGEMGDKGREVIARLETLLAGHDIFLGEGRGKTELNAVLARALQKDAITKDFLSAYREDGQATTEQMDRMLLSLYAEDFHADPIAITQEVLATLDENFPGKYSPEKVIDFLRDNAIANGHSLESRHEAAEIIRAIGTPDRTLTDVDSESPHHGPDGPVSGVS